MQPHSSCELKTKGYTEGKLSPSAGTNGGSGGQRLVSIVFAVLVFLISYILVDYLALSCFARIAVDIEGSVSSKVTAYYSTTARHEVFKESQTSSEGQYDAGKRVLLTLHFNNNTVKKLRLDPGDRPGTYKIYSISLTSYFGQPVNLLPFAPDLAITAGPGTVITKKPEYLEISASTDDPYCIFERPLAVHNPYYRFGVPLAFALLGFIIAGKTKPAQFRFWQDVQGKKSSSGVNFQALDGLRGVAALLVITDHAGVPGCRGLGLVGVVIFFCLSGFLLSVPFVQDGAKILNVSYLKAFFLRRICRIVPMYYAIVFAAYFFNNKIETALRSALFLEGDGIYWTVLQEIHFYILLPIVILVGHLFLRNKIWLVVIFLAALSFAFNQGLLPTYKIYAEGTTQRLYFGIFLGGMMACYLVHIEAIGKSKSLIKLCGNHFLTLGLFVGILLSQQLWLLAHPGHGLLANWVLTRNFSYLVAALIFALVMSEGSWVAKILRCLPLRLLGTVSYSFYLLHPIFIRVIKDKSLYYLHIYVDNTVACVAALALTLIASTITYTYIERPFIKKAAL